MQSEYWDRGLGPVKGKCNLNIAGLLPPDAMKHLYAYSIENDVFLLILCRRKDANARTNTVLMAPMYGAESGSAPGKRSVPCVPRSDAEPYFHDVRRNSSSEYFRADGGDGGTCMDESYRTLPGCPPNSATKKHLYESPLFSHGANRSPARSAVYYELAANANRPTVIGRGQMPMVPKGRRSVPE